MVQVVVVNQPPISNAVRESSFELMLLARLLARSVLKDAQHAHSIKQESHPFAQPAQLI
jgi:hypothetical protein